MHRIRSLQARRYRTNGKTEKKMCIRDRYMAPEPHRGTRNDSSNSPYVISKIAEIKGTTPDEVERTTRANAFELFKMCIRDRSMCMKTQLTMSSSVS